MKTGDRVRFIDKDFLSDGVITAVHGSIGGGFVAYTVTLDKRAPNEYAWNTFDVLAFPYDIEVIK